jgi:hypothetical protein
MDATDGIFVVEPVSWGSDRRTENTNGRLSFAGELPFIACNVCRVARKNGMACVAPDSVPLWKPANARWPSKVTSRAELNAFISIAMQDPRNQNFNGAIDPWLIPAGMSLLPAELFLGADKGCALLFPSRLVVSEALWVLWGSRRLNGARFVEVHTVRRGQPVPRRFYLCFVEARPFFASHGPFGRCDNCGASWVPKELLPDQNPRMTSDLAWFGDTGVLLASHAFVDAVAATGELPNANFVPFTDWFGNSYGKI